jgi:protein TonB
MREAAVPGPMFAGASMRPARPGRRIGFLAASALLQGSALAMGLFLLQRAGSAERPARLEPVVAVRLLQPQLRPPSPPPARGQPAPRSPAPASAPNPTRMVQPREVPAELPRDAPLPEAIASAMEGARGDGATGARGHPDGVIGGEPGTDDGPAPQQSPARPIAARTHDLASVRAGIARALVYPPGARRNGLQGKVVVEFVLLADGRIRELVLRSSSGFPPLDAAAMAAVERAAPFPPPGVDVLVVVPVVFRTG